MKLEIFADADAEMHAAAEWYESRVAGLGEHFLQEVLDAYAAIEAHPERYAKPAYSGGRKLHRKMLAHFPYYVVYEMQEERLTVIAVAHSARKPGYWRERLG